ncbi:MAG: branched-chain amino acid ABC transporter ATP-binding protein/permease [Microthrixaceae bacterium]
MTSRRLAKLVLLGLLLTFPYLPFVPFSFLGNVDRAAAFALIAISLVVLTGWVGQISLGHAGLVGTGAYVTGLATGGLHIGFPVSLLWGAAAGMLIAVLLGVVALRVRGLYLAVATLIFSWVAQEFLFVNGVVTKHASVTIEAVGKRDTIPYFDWNSRAVYYYGAWSFVALTIFLISNLRDSKTGRAFFAVRGSEVAAASLGIDVMRTKLMAFALSGALAGAAGSLMLIYTPTVGKDMFTVTRSLFFLSIAVVGGLASLGGAVAAALVFASLDELFFRFKAFEGYLDVVAAALLAAVLLLYRGGLAAIPNSLAPVLAPLGRAAQPTLAKVDAVLASATAAPARAWSRLATSPSQGGADGLVIQRESRILSLAAKVSAGRVKARRAVVRTFEPLDLDAPALEPGLDAGDVTLLDADSTPVTRSSNGHAMTGAAPLSFEVVRPVELPAVREDRRILLKADGITVQFGGLLANEDVNLIVREGEIVGLIGPNGAGKTTCFNAIAGLNVPSRGTIELFGQDVTDLTVHQRALIGVGRTFQAIQLFGQLTVFENLLVATHQHNPTGFLAHLVVSPAALSAEATARRQVQRVIELLGLGDVALRQTKDLPFGVLRMVEVARALVTGARLIMLDEPASGLDNAETDRLADLVRYIRSLGVTILLIEHDVRMVTSVSDYLYVLNGGRLLAEGTPQEVARDERVIAAYLGRADQADAADEAVSA